MKRWGVGETLADLLSDVLNGLVARPGRSLLLTMVFAVGAGGFVSSLGISQTAAQQVTQRLTPADVDEVHVRPVIEQSDEGAIMQPFPDDVDKRVAPIPGVVASAVLWQVDGDSAAVSPFRQPAGSVTNSLGTPPAVGADSRWLELVGVTTTPPGAAWQLSDQAMQGHVALVGRDAARKLGISNLAAGKAFWVANRRFDVVGLIDDTGRQPELRTSVVVSPSAAQALGGNGARPTLFIRTRSGYAHAVSEVVAPIIRPDRPGVVAVQPVIDLQHLRRGIATDLDRLVALASTLVLGLAGLTIANAMVVSVLTRRAEIGLRRALGASRRHIALLFLTEGALVGLAGGLLGVSAGLAAVVGVAKCRSWTPVLTTELIPLGIFSGALVGLIFSFYPAWRATRIEPAEAVRHRG